MPGSTREIGEEALFRSMLESSGRFNLMIFVLLVIILWGAALYITQIRSGLAITGLNRPIYWGFYIINFVFFIGISHAGTLISAILRLCNAEWRRPVTRMAEVITLVVLCIGALHPVIDLGRPERVLNMFQYGRLQSPLVWDVISITAYLTASSMYLFLPLIPDIAIIRDSGRTSLRWLYDVLSWGWEGTPRQHEVLNRGMNILMIMVIPIAVSVHTIIAYIFAMTIKVGWHSTIFGPYFVVGAIFSGIAALILTMAILSKIFGLQHYLKEIHFTNLAKLMLLMAGVWVYFTFSEHLTGYFGSDPHELEVLHQKLTGQYAFLFWTMLLCNFVIPVACLAFPRWRSINTIVAASAAVVIGMWLERYLIIVPTLSYSRMVIGQYVPTLVEVGLFLAAISTFCLGFLLFGRFFPLICIWEIREGRDQAVKKVAERIRTYQPGVDAPTPERRRELSSSRVPIAPIPRSVAIAQYFTISGIWLLLVGMQYWLGRAVINALMLGDTPRATLVIAVIAMAVFVTLVVVFTYVFFGLRRGRWLPAEAERNSGV